MDKFRATCIADAIEDLIDEKIRLHTPEHERPLQKYKFDRKEQLKDVLLQPDDYGK